MIVDPAKLEHLVGTDQQNLEAIERTGPERALELAIYAVHQSGSDVS